MKKRTKQIIIGILAGIGIITISGVIIVAFLISKFFKIPESQDVYVSDLANSTLRYTLIYEDQVLFIDIDPECEHETEKIKSSDFYADMEDGPEPLNPNGYMWKYCDKQSKWTMEIKAIDIDGGTKIYTLYYKSPGEKGSQYRETLIQTPDTIIKGNLEGDRTTYQDMMEDYLRAF